MNGWLRDLLAAADAGPWWFDGRDIFHKQPGTNLDQIIIPIPSAEETFHPSQAVTPATARLAALAPELARWAVDAADVLHAWDEDEAVTQLLARLDALAGATHKEPDERAS